MMQELWKEHETRLKQVPPFGKIKIKLNGPSLHCPDVSEGDFLTRCFMTRCLRVAFACPRCPRCPRCPHHNYSSIRSKHRTSRFWLEGKFSALSIFLLSKLEPLLDARARALLMHWYYQTSSKWFTTNLTLRDSEWLWTLEISFWFICSICILFYHLCLYINQIVNFHWSHYSNDYLVCIHWETLNHIDSQALKLEPVVTWSYPHLSTMLLTQLRGCVQALIISRKTNNHFSSQNVERQRKWLQKSQYQFSGCQRPSFHTA